MVDLQRRESFMENIPKPEENLFARAFSGKSLRWAVKAKCYECCGYDKTEARECTSVICPLYEVNPYKKAYLKRQVKLTI